MDTQSADMLLSNSGMYFDAEMILDAGNLSSGLTDDVRIYNPAVSPPEKPSRHVSNNWALQR